MDAFHSRPLPCLDTLWSSSSLPASLPSRYYPRPRPWRRAAWRRPGRSCCPRRTSLRTPVNSISPGLRMHTRSRLTKSVFQAGVLNRCCLPPEAIWSNMAMSSLSSGMTFRFDSIRDGVTDLGRTTVPLLTAHEMRTVATEAWCLSATFFRSASECKGESGGSVRVVHGSRSRQRCSGQQRRGGVRSTYW